MVFQLVPKEKRGLLNGEQREDVCKRDKFWNWSGIKKSPTMAVETHIEPHFPLHIQYNFV